MVESESIPVSVIFEQEQDKGISDFHTGQNTMLLRDDDGSVYKTGLKLDYSPKKLDFFEEFPKEDIK